MIGCCGTNNSNKKTNTTPQNKTHHNTLRFTPLGQGWESQLLPRVGKAMPCTASHQPATHTDAPLYLTSVMFWPPSCLQKRHFSTQTLQSCCPPQHPQASKTCCWSNLRRESCTSCRDLWKYQAPSTPTSPSARAQHSGEQHSGEREWIVCTKNSEQNQHTFRINCQIIFLQRQQQGFHFRRPRQQKLCCSHPGREEEHSLFLSLTCQGSLFLFTLWGWKCL